MSPVVMNIFNQSLLNTDILLRDGIGMQFLHACLGKPPGINMNGTDFLPRVIESVSHKPIAICGTHAHILDKAAVQLKKQQVNVVYTKHGYATTDEYITGIIDSGAEVVLLAMGMPKQEALAQQLKEKAVRPLLIINGGGIIDFISGHIPRAPLWLRNLGLEWLYRLWQEPSRLWKRYLLGSPLFLIKAFIAGFWLRFNKPPADKA